MLYNLIIFCSTGLIVILYLSYKYLRHRQEILEILIIENQDKDPSLHRRNYLSEIKIKSLGRLSVVYNYLENLVKIAFHWLLHLFVIILKFLSQTTDVLYFWARDFFLQTAVKEKQAVARFWHHLKEYKKEKEGRDTRLNKDVL